MKFLILCLLLVLVTSDTLSILLNALKEAEEGLSEAGNVDDRPDHIGRNRRNYRSNGGNVVRHRSSEEAEEDLSENALKEAGNVDDRPDHIGRNRRNYKSSGGNRVRAYILDHANKCPHHPLSAEQCIKWADQNGKSWERTISTSSWPSGCIVSADVDANGRPRHSARIGVYFNNGGSWARQSDQVYLVCPP